MPAARQPLTRWAQEEPNSYRQLHRSAGTGGTHRWPRKPPEPWRRGGSFRVPLAGHCTNWPQAEPTIGSPREWTLWKLFIRRACFRPEGLSFLTVLAMVMMHAWLTDEYQSLPSGKTQGKVELNCQIAEEWLTRGTDIDDLPRAGSECQLLAEVLVLGHIFLYFVLLCTYNWIDDVDKRLRILNHIFCLFWGS